MRRTIPLLALVLLLAGCTASPEDAGASMCADKLQYAIEQEVPIAESWLDSELQVSDVETRSASSEVAAFDVEGTATVTLASGRELTVAWTCFTQTVDGKTYAAIQSVG